MGFGRFASGGKKAPQTEKGERIYAIGDVHGELELLRRLLNDIEAHSAALPPVSSVHVILLGDLIDRGAESAGVLRFAHSVQQRTERLVVLKGNHEELMLRTLDGEPGMLSAWIRMGGDATLKSFGIEPPVGPEHVRSVCSALTGKVSRDMQNWMRNLPLTARSGDYLFCHAGIRPGVALRRQTNTDLLWIREDFLRDTSDHGVVVVHGHSISTDVQMRPNRIGIDTGAFRTGVLTALYLEGTERQVISVTADKPEMEMVSA